MRNLLRKLKPAVSKNTAGVSETVSENASKIRESHDSRSLQNYLRHIDRIFDTEQIAPAGKRVVRLSRVDKSFRHFGLGFEFITYRAASKLNDAIKLSEQIAMVTRSENVRAYRDHQWLMYEFQLPQEKWRDCHVTDLPTPQAIGVGPNNKPILFGNFEKPHTALFGLPGSGKTNMLRAVVRGLALSYDPEDLGIVICDPNAWFDDFTNLAHLVYPIAQSREDQEQAVDYVFGEFKRRQTEKIKDGKRLVLILDEATETVPTAKDDKIKREKILTQLEAICRLARGVRINVIFGTQTAKETDFPGIVKMLDNRFCGRVHNSSQSHWMTGLPGMDAHKLTGKGDFLHIQSSNRADRFQVPWIDEKDLIALPRREVLRPSAIPIEQIEIDDFDQVETDTQNRGRPSASIEPATLAIYADFYASNNKSLPSVRQAQEMGFGRTTHTIHRDFWTKFIAKLAELRRLKKNGQ